MRAVDCSQRWSKSERSSLRLENGLPFLVQSGKSLCLPLRSSQPLTGSSRVFHSAHRATDHLLSALGTDQMILFTPEDRCLRGNLKANRALNCRNSGLAPVSESGRAGSVHSVSRLASCRWSISSCSFWSLAFVSVVKESKYNSTFFFFF